MSVKKTIKKIMALLTIIGSINNFHGSQEHPKKPITVETNYYEGVKQFYLLRTLTAYILLAGSVLCNSFLINLFHLIHWSQS